MSKSTSIKKELSLKQRDELLAALKDRFEKKLNRHPGLVWAKVQTRIEQMLQQADLDKTQLEKILQRHKLKLPTL
jgi:hypothetical protein